tara:strand:+ start:197 stop:499 length:303 start_codon:yes stop_codon:yes gene_type:complete
MRRSFKEYLKHWEDAAANSVGAGGIAMPADMMPKDKHKKHKDRVKKSMYDGRTKEGKKFVERILARRAAKEAKKEGFKSDAQRKAAFASGYKAKGKKKDK